MAEFSFVSFLMTILEYSFAMANEKLLRFILLCCNVSLSALTAYGMGLELNRLLCGCPNKTEKLPY